MRDISIDNISWNDVIDNEQLSEAFKGYLRKVLKYNKSEAEYIASEDFANPYECPFIIQEPRGTVAIDGKEYEVRYCYTEFQLCGMYFPNTDPFKFYMMFDLDTLPDKSVRSYRDAEKIYVI